jgi:hypothetical protein
MNMKKISFILVVLASVTACTVWEKDGSVARQAEAIIGKHVIRFTKPGERIPSRTSVYAPLLGNGYTGIAIAGQPEQQVFYAARNDFWRLKHGHNERLR